MKHLGADERVVNSQNVNIGITTLAIRCWQSVMHQRKEKTTEKFSCDKLYTDYIQKVTSEKIHSRKNYHHRREKAAYLHSHLCKLL